VRIWVTIRIILNSQPKTVRAQKYIGSKHDHYPVIQITMLLLRIFFFYFHKRACTKQT